MFLKTREITIFPHFERNLLIINKLNKTNAEEMLSYI